MGGVDGIVIVQLFVIVDIDTSGSWIKAGKARIIHVWLPHPIPSGPQMHRLIHASQKYRSENKIGMKEEIK